MDRDLFSCDQPVADQIRPAAASEARWPDFNPHAATREIVCASSAERRRALLSAVPSAWRDTILHFVVVAIAGRVFAAIPAERERLRAIIPEEWIPEVRAHLERYAAQASARAAIEAARSAGR